ncbi:MAG: sigma-54-dependent Fis family transcriptional regulator [Bradymonadaceae bacterium]|nr:sigma-54-dependent Fis family transcriptional regulator [Lujinxingiaceae bacterium]
MSPKTLSPSERNFFELVEAAAFANPFGQQRAEHDVSLAHTKVRDAGEQAEQAVLRVRAGLEDLWPLSLGEFEGRDREILEAAVLFDTFHRFREDFDDLVERQRLGGEQPVQASFGKQVIARLVEQGLSAERALRFVGIFYQMRRAFYFAHHDLKGTSLSMRRLRERLWENVFTHDVRLYEGHLWDRMEDFSTFLVGQTGSGKGAAAAVLGRSSWIPYDELAGRFARSFTELFVPINLSQYPESLIESELFGHKKGAFTGAIEAHDGVFGRCQRHGVIFLDEIGEVSIPVQIKLLRVLQERLYTPVGSHKAERFEGRTVAATNRPLEQLRREGQFRDDFYYRLCSDVIELPSLRQRLDEDPSELQSLVEHIVTAILKQPIQSVIERVLTTIKDHLPSDYPWPGNVRELEQCTRRAIIGRPYEGDPFGARHTVAAANQEATALAQAVEAGTLEARTLLTRYCQLLYARYHTYEEVGRRTGLDRRTVKRHIEDAI